MLNPNPALSSNGVWIHSKNDSKLNGVLFINNSLGQEIMKVTIQNELVKLISTHQLSSGVYLVRFVNDSNETQTEKLIIK